MVDYQLSGAVEARAGGALVPLGGPKQRCVLAVLLVNHGSVVSVDRLIDAVWEDNPPPKALASLRAYVTNLRRILPVSTDTASPAKARLASRAYGYQLTLLGDDSVDLHRFEKLVKDGRSALIRGAAADALETLSTALTLTPRGMSRCATPRSRHGSTPRCSAATAVIWFPRSRPRSLLTRPRNGS